MKNILDKKFSNGIWFKGQGLTRRQVLEWASTGESGISLIKKPALQQDDNLFSDTIYDYVLKSDERGGYRLTQEEYNYYIQRKEFWDNWRVTEKPKYSEDIYPIYYELVKKSMLKVPEYADFYNSFKN